MASMSSKSGYWSPLTTSHFEIWRSLSGSSLSGWLNAAALVLRSASNTPPYPPYFLFVFSSGVSVSRTAMRSGGRMATVTVAVTGTAAGDGGVINSRGMRTM